MNARIGLFIYGLLFCFKIVVIICDDTLSWAPLNSAHGLYIMGVETSPINLFCVDVLLIVLTLLIIYIYEYI